MEVLEAEEDFKSLNSMARVNHVMYDLAIPWIYKTVVITDKYSRKLGYGHRKNLPRLANGNTFAISHLLLCLQTGSRVDTTRKDVATTYIRKLVLNGLPKVPISEYYDSINEIVLGEECLVDTREYSLWLDMNVRGGVQLAVLRT
jgi:hypothetical protein